jgi:hypothetical protein
MFFLRSRLLHCSFLFIFAALLAFGSCTRASGPVFGAGLSGADESGLYLYRRGALAAYGQHFAVLVDGKPAGFIANASYLRLPLAPGSHRLQVKPGGIAQVTTLQVEAGSDGRTFYEFVFPTGWDMRPSFHGAAIEARPEPLARVAMQGLRRVAAAAPNETLAPAHEMEKTGAGLRGNASSVNLMSGN